MSWDASLRCEHCDADHGDGWNYTHNTNRMISAALERVTGTPPAEYGDWFSQIVRSSWIDALDGAPWAKGRALLAALSHELATHPERYDPMNPENRWGRRDRIAAHLAEMAAYTPEKPDVLRWAIR